MADRTVMAQGERSYFDPDGFVEDGAKWLDDPFERAAVALWLASFNTPEDAAVALARDGGVKAWALWAGSHESDRHLYRRRAALALHGEV